IASGSKDGPGGLASPKASCNGSSTAAPSPANADDSPASSQIVEPSKTNTKPILDRARTEWRERRLNASVHYLFVAVFPSLAVLITGVLALWIGRGFLEGRQG